MRFVELIDDVHFLILHLLELPLQLGGGLFIDLDILSLVEAGDHRGCQMDAKLLVLRLLLPLFSIFRLNQLLAAQWIRRILLLLIATGFLQAELGSFPLLINLGRYLLDLHGIDEDLEAAHAGLHLLLRDHFQLVRLKEIRELSWLPPQRQQLLTHWHVDSLFPKLDRIGGCDRLLLDRMVAHLLHTHLWLMGLLVLVNALRGISALQIPPELQRTGKLFELLELERGLLIRKQHLLPIIVSRTQRLYRLIQIPSRWKEAVR